MQLSNIPPKNAGEELSHLLQLPEEEINLAEAALLIATSAYPDLDCAKYLHRLDDMAQTVAERVSDETDPLQIIKKINEHLYAEVGFTGNSRDYYDPRNSFLNDVLDRKTGIPIMLSTVYLEVARRIRFPLVGVGLPGHFLVKHPFFNLLIDPFSKGELLTEKDCESRMHQVLGDEVPFDKSYLEGVTKKHTVTRMLNNLRNVYMTARQFSKALRMTDLILALHPDSAENLRQRAALLMEARSYSKAIAALELYLKHDPDAEDAEELRQTVVNLLKTLAQMN